MLRVLVVCAIFGATFALPNRLSFPLDGRIVGGKNTSIEEVPYQVALYRGNSFLCGGSIISETEVLTAMHCIEIETDPSNLFVRVGATKLGEGQKVVVKKIIKNPKWGFWFLSNDIAVLELTEKLTFGPKINKVALPEPDEVPEVGKKALISGWGTLYSQGPTAEILQSVLVPIFDLERCQKIYDKIEMRVDDSMFCAGYIEGRKDTCQGDSGGPLVLDGKLYGVVSWGNGCALPGYPGVYASVSKNLDFIKENARV